jgi:Holliday junction DNA helicase RuvA
MYSYISGSILSIEGVSLTLLIEWTGLGLEVLASPLLLSHVSWESIIQTWIHHHKTDMSEVLFAFVDRDERSLFRELLKVNGVWWKTALSLLWLWKDTLVQAIQLEDDKLISSVPWIGKKTAQKIIVDLKWSIDFSKKQWTKNIKNTSNVSLISSLVQMGYDKHRVESLLEEIDESLTLEEKTREAIKKLATT